MKNQGFIDTIIAKIINNFQVTIKNIHARYEDNLSVPGVRTLSVIPRCYSLFQIGSCANVTSTPLRLELPFQDLLSLRLMVTGKKLLFLPLLELSIRQAVNHANEHKPGSDFVLFEKLAELHSFALYFNTDNASMAGLSSKESAEKFRSLVRFHRTENILSSTLTVFIIPQIATDEQPVSDHQFLLKPVSGQGKVCLKHYSRRSLTQTQL